MKPVGLCARAIQNSSRPGDKVADFFADGESVNSNEASAMPQAQSGHSLLRITMNDSSEREYQLSSTEVDDFIKWCDRTVGTGSSLYTFNKDYNVGEFQSRKEYLLFEQIVSFEVMQLEIKF